MLLVVCLFLAGVGAGEARESLSVFVSIPPQKYFVERVAGETVKVSVMVKPGADPVTYEPSPRQMAELSEAKAYFRIGVPFEAAWLSRLRQNQPNLAIVDTREGITLRAIEGHAHGPHGMDKEKAMPDPHIWLSPRLVKKQAETIYLALVDLNPDEAATYLENYQLFVKDLEAIDQQIRSIIGNGRGRKFMVFHPAWGYFADEYGLQQIPIEVEGKEPSAKELARIIDQAHRDNIKVIFVQSQFNTKPAETIAKAVSGRVVQLDPLAEDYLTNLVVMAEAIGAEAR
ncbi:MAG: zinc ABC transporter solute-binding protein [Firmicutes bacterium]|nr:zinc ABC transporter solute-binding protein [Bacillota bacterium]